MKIIHTGDWHIGKLVHGIHMTEDQRFILKQLIELIDTEKPDVLIIAGDLYDRSVPPVEAVELLDSVLSEIVMKHKTKVIAIAGNHDSPDRLGFASKLLRDNGLYIAGNMTERIEPIQMQDAFGSVDFYAIPYAEPAVVRAVLQDENVKNHETAMKAQLEIIKENMDKSKRNICIAHAFVMGTETLETSESERPLSIGGSEYVDVNDFDAFEYVAIGHLHKPQKVKHDYIRYAGSLLKYSFSEALQKKSITVVNMDASGKVEITFKALKPLHEMRIIKGKLENLIDPSVYKIEDTNDYIMAILTDRGELIDPIGTLRSIYPNILRLDKEQFDREAGENSTSASDDFANKSPLDLFKEFYENVSGEDFDAEKSSIVADILDDIHKKERLA